MASHLHADDGSLASDQIERIDALFAQWDRESSPGAAVGVVRHGELVYSQGFGLADLEHDVPIDSTTVFYMASVSKHVVTMCILLLEEQGKLDLDDEIQEFLPDFPRYEAPLTIRHFIHHTSGVRDSLSLWSLAGNDILDHIDETALYELIKRQKSLNFPPGERYLYSNSCYFMLAMIVKEASGVSIKEFAEEHLFGPLGMTQTHFHDDVDHIIKNRAFSYRRSGDTYNNIIMRFDLVGSGGLYSNIEDMARWDRNFNDNRLGNGGPDLIEKMQQEGLLNNGESSGYAFGLINGEFRGLRTLEHGGALAGYRTYYLRFPDPMVSIVVLANASNFRTSVARDVAAIVLEEELTPLAEPEENPEARTPPRNTGTTEDEEKALDVEELEEFTGGYFSEELNVSYELYIEFNFLKCRIVNRYRQPWFLVPNAEDSFRSFGQYTFRFSRREGEITGFHLDAGRVQNLEFVRE